MSTSGLTELPVRLALHVDAVCRRFEAAWKEAAAGGERPRLESYLAGTDGPVRAALVRELLPIEVHYRRRAGDEPRAADYQAGLPDLNPAWLATVLASAPGPRAPDAGPPDEPTAMERDRSPGNGGAAGDTPTVPGYHVLELLGQGGMGVVYKARQHKLNRLVALKMVLAGGLAKPRELERFRTEAEAVAQLQHPNIVQIYEIGEYARRPFLALEYVDGGSLDECLAGFPQPARAAAQLVETLARAMHYAHECGIVHRDLKPANVLLAGGRPLAAGRRAEKARSSALFTSPNALVPKITDFGLAKLLDSDAAGPTRTGDVLGTPSYMAPEQASGKLGVAGPATDVYGLGTILYELLTGHPPFRAESALETLLLVRSAEPVSPSRLQLKCPRDLETICLKCLQKEPGKRYPSALALAEDLRRFLAGEPIQARPAGVVERARKWVRRNPSTAAWLGLVVLLVALGFTAVTWYALRADERRREAELAGLAAQEARDEARATLYFQQVGRALLEWRTNNQEQAERLLRLTEGHDRAGWEWGYVRGLCASDLLTLGGHGDQVSCVAFSPDGRWLASATGAWHGTRPAEVKLWDAATGQLLRTFDGTVAPIRGLAFSPDGRRLATASYTFRSGIRGGVTVWDVTTGRPVGDVLGNTVGAFSVAFSPDGRSLATGGADGRVQLWDSATGEHRADLSQHDKGQGVYGLAFSPDGQTVASGAWNGTLRLWDLGAKQERKLSGIKDVRSVAFSPDGRHVATASFIHGVMVWDVTSGQPVVTHPVHANPVKAVAFCPDGRSLASADSSGTVYVSETLRAGSSRPLRGHTGSVECVAFSPDGARLATAGSDGTVKVWDVWRGQESRTLWVSNLPASTSMAYSPDGRHLATAGSGGGTSSVTVKDVQVWDVESGAVRRTLRGAHGRGVTAVAYSPDGAALATASLDGTAKLWDAATGRAAATLEGHTQAVTAVAFSPDGRSLATAGQDRTVRLWDAAGRSRRALSGHTGPVTAVAFSPDGRLLASAGEDQTVRLWDAARFELLDVLPAHTAAVACVAFSPDGAWLASAGEDRTVVLWEVAPRRERYRCSGHTRPVTALAFSPDGRRLASSSLDGSVKLWDVATGVEAFVLHGYLGGVLSVAFRPDGRQLVAGTSDWARILVWDLDAPRDERVARAAAGARAWHRSTAAASERDRQWFAAAFHLERLIAAQPGDGGLRARHITALAEQGVWDQAEAACARAAGRGDAAGTILFFQALLRLRAGDRAGYRALCQKALEASAQTAGASLANGVAWTCALASDAGVDPARVVALAERAVAGNPRRHMELNTLGTALYRAGRFEEAVQRLDEARQAHGRGGLVEDWLVLAMAHKRLGHQADARQWLDKAVEFLDKALAPGSAGPAPPWYSRIVWPLLRGEAEALIQGGNP